VYALGFRPGFPFLGVVDPRLAAPRRPAPRPRVAAGSVGVAGRQTGVYPSDGPGGWRILGRTPLRVFDPGREPAFLLRAGDRVRFVALDEAAFRALAEGADRAG
jgi:KipI family sensor histidine kinase inhibitor